MKQDSKTDGVVVVIPMYNGEKTIKKVLQSIDNQTIKSMLRAVIIVDDGSTDLSVEIVKEYKKNTDLNIIIEQKSNGGVSTARNAGMRRAVFDFPNVKWIAFCDDDDLWLPNKLERQMDVLQDNSSIDCLGTQFNEVELKIGGKKVQKLTRGTVKDICIHNFPQPSTVIMKASIFRQMGGFDEKQKYAEDGNFFMRVAHNFNLYYLPECLIEYGFGKRAFGVNGLSGNLKGMYEGNKKNLRDMRKEGYIGVGFYYEMRVYYFLKYLRRLVISKTAR